MGNKVSKLIKTGFDSEPVYNEHYLKSKTKSYEGKIIQIIIMIKSQIKVLIALVYQWFWLTLLLKWLRTIPSSVFRRMEMSC